MNKHILLLLTIILFMYSTAGCVPQTPLSLDTTQVTTDALTLAHEVEVRSLIETYHLNVDSFNIQRDPNSLSQLITGPLLESLLSSTQGEPDSLLYRAHAITVSEVHIVEYTSSQIKAVACSELALETVSFEGEYIQSLPPHEMVNIYVFVLEETTWKLFTLYGLLDIDSAIRDWEYVSEDQREAIGNLSDYYAYATCNVSQ